MRVNTYQLENLSTEERTRLLRRSETDIAALREVVEPIIDGVRRGGDAALIEYGAKFDGVSLEKGGLRVTPDEFGRAADRLDPRVREAIAAAVTNIRRYHEAQIPEAMWMKEIVPGVLAGEKITRSPPWACTFPAARARFPP